MKKTTVEISDDLMAAAKTVIERERISFRQLIEQGLRLAIQQRRGKSQYRYRPVTFRGDGLTPEFEGAGWEKIREAIYRGHGE